MLGGREWRALPPAAKDAGRERMEGPSPCRSPPQGSAWLHRRSFVSAPVSCGCTSVPVARRRVSAYPRCSPACTCNTKLDARSPLAGGSGSVSRGQRVRLNLNFYYQRKKVPAVKSLNQALTPKAKRANQARPVNPSGSVSRGKD